jgi:hypothetical protein
MEGEFPMNINRSSLFWGILLIGAGVLALGAQMGYIENLTSTSWIFVFAAISLIAFVSYAMSGWTQWGWLSRRYLRRFGSSLLWQRIMWEPPQ